MTRSIAILLFDDIEVLDFAGPFEVFSTASRVMRKVDRLAPAPFKVFTVGAGGQPISARGGLEVVPRYSFADHPPIDVLLIPGGDVGAELQKPATISWIERCARQAELTASVCTGAFLLGKARLLAGKKVTTHWKDIAQLRQDFPAADVRDDQRWIDEGALITSAGISAGLDMSLHLVARLTGMPLARQTARQMDYDWRDCA